MCYLRRAWDAFKRNTPLYPYGCYLYMWEDKRVPVGVLRGHEADPQCGVLHDSQKHGLVLISGDAGGTVCVWSCTSFRCLWSQRVHDVGAGVIQVVVVPEEASSRPEDEAENSPCCTSTRGDILVTQSRAGHVYVWKIVWEESRFECLQRLHENTVFSFTKCSVLQRGEYSSHVLMACIGSHEAVVVVRCALCSHIECTFDARLLTINHGMCTSLAALRDASSDDVLVFAGYEDGSLLLWSISSRKGPIRELEKIHKSPVLSISTIPCRQYGVTGSAEDGMLQLFRYDGEGISMDNSLSIKDSGVDHVVFRGDGKYIAAACWDGRVRIFHTRRGKLVDIFKYHTAGATFVCFSNSVHPCTICVGSRDGTISTWSIP